MRFGGHQFLTGWLDGSHTGRGSADPGIDRLRRCCAGHGSVSRPTGNPWLGAPDSQGTKGCEAVRPSLKGATVEQGKVARGQEVKRFKR